MGIQAGIIRLHARENDTQEPHSVDEVYYVIEGNGFIRLNGKDHEIRQGTYIFVLLTGLGASLGGALAGGLF
ncbi:MAG: cupin domain-containing protein [Candidatus Nitrosopolaris sp.]|jgi:mannose-6-phosphate isomerase-like protein (cupin superfamily)